jgi:hypothetical protein
VVFVIEASSSTTTCDSISMHRLSDVGNQKTCVKQSSGIPSADMVFVDPTESNIKVFYFFQNKQLFYLPLQVYKAAPDLLMIDAPYSEIKAISKKNFEKLTKLEFLWLHFNKIEIIPAGTFADLVSLKKISLGEKVFTNIFHNSLKQINNREQQDLLSHWRHLPTIDSYHSNRLPLKYLHRRRNLRRTLEVFCYL